MYIAILFFFLKFFFFSQILSRMHKIRTNFIYLTGLSDEYHQTHSHPHLPGSGAIHSSAFKKANRKLSLDANKPVGIYTCIYCKSHVYLYTYTVKIIL